MFGRLSCGISSRRGTSRRKKSEGLTGYWIKADGRDRNVIRQGSVSVSQITKNGGRELKVSGMTLRVSVRELKDLRDVLNRAFPTAGKGAGE